VGVGNLRAPGIRTQEILGRRLTICRFCRFQFGHQVLRTVPRFTGYAGLNRKSSNAIQVDQTEKRFELPQGAAYTRCISNGLYPRISSSGGAGPQMLFLKQSGRSMVIDGARNLRCTRFSIPHSTHKQVCETVVMP